MTTGTGTQRWAEAPLGDLIDHILTHYHQPLNVELPRLEAMARDVSDCYRDKAESMFSDVLRTLQGLRAELEQHMAKEEQILFPLIKQGQGAMADGPISVMEQEHENANAALGRLRILTDDYEVPEGAGDGWRALWHGLESLESSLHEHIQLENDILFPRALESR
jgi:regulator of cell morphogenesis and NO signaling